MGRVLTNKTSLAVAAEASLGVLPGSPLWRLLEPNTIGKYGAKITTVARNPISKLRQKRKGTVTDLDSGVEFEHDLISDVFNFFAEGFVFATFTTIPFHRTSNADTLAAVNGSPSSYTFSTALAGAPAANTLLFARGFTNAANNGFHVVAAASTTTTVKVAETLVSETPTAAQHAQIDVCGFRTAAGDLDVDSNGNLTSTALDFTTLGLVKGQMIWVGGSAAGNNFTNAANKGYARVVNITANLLTLDKRSQAFVVEANTTQQVDILFGRFLRNVPSDNSIFLERSFQFELLEPNLQNPGPGDMYEYSKGNLCNEVKFEMPITNKAKVTFGFIGTDTPPPTTSRASGASTPSLPVATEAFNTTSGIAKLRIQKVDETGITTCFKNLTLTLGNNVTPEKCLGTLGAVFMNEGNFDVTMDTTLLFTDFEVPTAIRNNTTVTMDWVLKNNDGAIGFDIPSLTLGDGTKNFPVNESVTIVIKGEAFVDATLQTSIGISLFPFVP